VVKWMFIAGKERIRTVILHWTYDEDADC